MAEHGIDPTRLPAHVGIIMDGNGRWAKKNGLARSAGHKKGLSAAKGIVAAASSLGIKYITLYTFSTENWKRTEEEVGYLMGLIKRHLRAEFDFYKKNGIRIDTVGNLDALPADVKSEILSAKSDTEGFSATTCILAINYGARDEIVRGVREILRSGKDAESLSERDISASLDTRGFPDIDLLIRTGGEKRLSNFLLWQCAYAELIFSDTLWPEYAEDEFLDDIAQFQKRNRRFGARTDEERAE